MAEFEKKQMPEFDMKKMAVNIRKLRERKKLSPREFADKLGIHVQRVYELERENQQHIPGSNLLWKISTVFETSLDELLATGQATRMTFPMREFWEYLKGIEQEMMKVEWKHKLFAARYAVLRFFSLLHQTDHALKFFVKARGGNEKDIDTLSSIQRFFNSRFQEGAYQSYEIYYEPEIIAFPKGKGK
ncbi:MAG: helix-turn-helix domain-containing protein [Ignavibacteriales bacterium]